MFKNNYLILYLQQMGWKSLMVLSKPGFFYYASVQTLDQVMSDKELILKCNPHHHLLFWLLYCAHNKLAFSSLLNSKISLFDDEESNCKRLNSNDDLRYECHDMQLQISETLEAYLSLITLMLSLLNLIILCNIKLQ